MEKLRGERGASIQRARSAAPQTGDLSGAAALYGAVRAAHARHFRGACICLASFISSAANSRMRSVWIGNAIAVNPARRGRAGTIAAVRFTQNAAAAGRGSRLLRPGAGVEARLRRSVDQPRRHSAAGAAAARRRRFLVRARVERSSRATARRLSNRAATLFELQRYEEAGAAYDVRWSRLMRNSLRAPAEPRRTAVPIKLRLAFGRRGQGKAAQRHTTGAGWRSRQARQRLSFPTPPRISGAARKPGSRTVARLPAPLWRGEKYAHERARVACLSADFTRMRRPIAAGVFEHHDRTRFATTGAVVPVRTTTATCASRLALKGFRSFRRRA